MTVVLLLAVGAFLGFITAWAIASGRCATHTLTLEVENALLQDRIAKLEGRAS